jgi:transposase
MSTEAIYVREISAEEEKELRAGLRSKDAFKLRRCQIVLQSQEEKSARQIAKGLGCSDQAVRNVIHAFNSQGCGCLVAKSSRPLKSGAIFDQTKSEQLKSLLHTSPREYGKNRSIWTLEMVAEVCFENKLTQKHVSDETIRAVLHRMGVNWKRARDWITSPDPEYVRKKRPGIA